jgi:two-component system sensor histidine kinase DegS
MSEPTATDESPLQLLIKDSLREFEQVQVELKEIDVLIQQSTGEVEKLARRHAQATNTLRHIQANIESMPREDIQEAYATVQDAQQRLFTMRGQLEKLQSDQKNMERYAAGAGAPGLSEDQPMIVRVVEALETERRRLSRSMHDGPAQSMTNFILQTEICQRLFNSDRQRAEQELIALKGAATDTFQRIRDFVFELRPMMLDDLGLVPTLRRYAEMFKNKYGIPVEVTIVGKDRRLNPHVEVAVFRIVQELLNNIRDHAQATQARITLEIEDDGVRAIVDDNGAGFSVDDALAEARQKGTVGLSTMFERVEMLGGRLDIDSKPGQGTHVIVSIPSLEEQALA